MKSIVLETLVTFILKISNVNIVIERTGERLKLYFIYRL